MELGFGEIVVILVLVLLFFGPSKLPQLGDSLGRGIRDFKKAMRDDEPAPVTAHDARAASPVLRSDEKPRALDEDASPNR